MPSKVQSSIEHPPGLDDNHGAGASTPRTVSYRCTMSEISQRIDRVTSGNRRTYVNPIICGDHPDPTVLRVGEREFWTATTSTEWAPYFPLMRSTDLVTWEHAGAVFDEAPAWSDGCYWAPELSTHAGRYYAYYVARRRAGGLAVGVAIADTISGPYLDHGPVVDEPLGAIDPMAYTDDRGVRRLIWKEDGNASGRPTTIRQQELSADGTRLVGEPRTVITNDCPWEGEVVEAPFMLRRDGYWYLFYSGDSCCGRTARYAMGVARSTSPDGPWEKYAANPILATNAYFRCPGHGSIVELVDGRTFLLYHAYVAGDEAATVGRQVLLDEIVFRNGWPEINGGRGPSVGRPSPFETRLRPRDSWFADDFAAGTLGHGWQRLRSEYAATRAEIDPARGLLLRADGPGIGSVAALAARGATDVDWIATTTIDATDAVPGTLAGIVAFGSRTSAVGIGLADGTAVLWRIRDGVFAVLARTPAPPRACARIAAVGSIYRFSWATEKGRWRDLGTPVDAPWLPPWDAGVRIALAVGGAEGAAAAFAGLRIAPFVPNVRYLMPPEPLAAAEEAHGMSGGVQASETR